MSQMDFDNSEHAPGLAKEIPEEQPGFSGELKNKANKRNKQRSQEWTGEIVANGYLMILYR